MTGRQGENHQQQTLTSTEHIQQEPSQQDVNGENEAKREAASTNDTSTLEDIKMPALETDHISHISTESMSVGPKHLTLDNDEILDSAKIQEDEAASPGGTIIGLTSIDKSKSSLAKLVKGWETYIAEGAVRNVQMLQNLNLCGAGEGLARIAGPGEAYEPLGFRHAHSSPLKYSSTMMMNSETPISLSSQIALDQVRRSSSTPSTSAFRQRSANSAFGVHLRTLPHLNGPDDRSAFSLPIHRTSYAAMSDPGISYSAFEPVPIAKTAPVDDAEKIAIEVTNVGKLAAAVEKDATDEKAMEEEENSRSSALGAASRAARFLSDVRFSRRRRRVRGGRENPARPSSDPSPPQESNVTLQVAIVEGNSSDHEDTPAVQSEINETTSSEYSSELKQEVDTMNRFTLIPEDRGQGMSLLDTTASSSEHYHQLDSDIDDECDEYQRIEASIHADSPGTIPSPSYHQIVDDRPNSTDVLRESALPSVRIQVSDAATTPVEQTNRHFEMVASPNPCEMAGGEGSSLTPQSQDSGRQSRSTHTTNTSGHTTLATSTSATSSGHLSAISETDREVMETNKAAKIRRRTLGSLELSVAKNDTDASVNSSSTTSTNPGYVALVGSNATLREGANVPADRFFKHSQSSSSGDVPATGVTSATGQVRIFTMAASSKGGGSANSPTTISSSSLAHTSSSSSSGEDPPTFVSYLDRQGASDLTSLREDVVSTERTEGDGAEERESPSEMVGYSEVIFEEADDLEDEESHQPIPIRPIKERLTGRLQKFRYRPPRSPVKGCRPLATPPPTGSFGDNVSPVHQHLSPPRNIVENPIETNLSRPHVVRSGPVLVSPDSGSGPRSILTRTAGVGREELELFGTQIGYLGDESRMLDHNLYTELASSPRLGRVHTFEEGSIEIWKTDSKDEATIVNTVSPEKSADDM